MMPVDSLGSPPRVSPGSSRSIDGWSLAGRPATDDDVETYSCTDEE